MDEPLKIWSKALLRLALVLLAIGLLPLLAITTILQGVSPLIPVLLSVSVAPIGAVCLLAAAILFLAALLRRRSKGPS